MSLKIEEVKAGDELVCIDFKGLADHRHDYMPQWLDDLMLSPIIVSNVNIDSNTVYFRNDSRYLDVSDFKYFKKKDQSQQYTFDDLINMSTKAVKDRLFVSIKTDFKSIIALWGVGDEEAQTVFHNGKHNQVNCEYIRRLYKENFVIESKEDLKRVKLNPKITLNNGEVIPFSFKSAVKDHLIFYDQPCGHNMIHFVFLKGATVEQERGCNE